MDLKKGDKVRYCTYNGFHFGTIKKITDDKVLVLNNRKPGGRWIERDRIEKDDGMF